MTIPTALAPARERNRNGLRPFVSDLDPDPGEAMIDKLFITVKGSVRARDEQSMMAFANLIGTNPTASSAQNPRLFGAGHWGGRKFTAPCVKGTTVTGGDLTLLARGSEARLTLKLRLNPLRTLAHLVERHEFDEIEHLPPAAFFLPTPDPAAEQATLDRRDNMIAEFFRFGGTVHTANVQRVATYLAAYEAALQGLLLQHLCPVEQGFNYGFDHGDVVASNEDCTVRLDWQSLAVSQCEACWERYHPDALSVVHSLADRIMATARVAEVQSYLDPAGASVGRELGALAVRLPLIPSGKVQLVIYAKSPDRVRIEVRFFEMPQDVRERLADRDGRLSDWFDAVRSDAATRVPWTALQGLMTPSPPLSLDALVDLVEAVAEVASKAPSKRREIIHRLLADGGITATDRNGVAPARMLKRLADRGVVEHVRLVARDAEIGRRYRLVGRFVGLTQR